MFFQHFQDKTSLSNTPGLPFHHIHGPPLLVPRDRPTVMAGADMDLAASESGEVGLGSEDWPI